MPNKHDVIPLYFAARQYATFARACTERGTTAVTTLEILMAQLTKGLLPWPKHASQSQSSSTPEHSPASKKLPSTKAPSRKKPSTPS